MSNKWLSGFDLARSRAKPKKKDGNKKLKRALDKHEQMKEQRELEKLYSYE